MEGGGEERIASIMLRKLKKDFELHLVLFNPPIDYEIPKEIKMKCFRPSYSKKWLRILTLPLVLIKYILYCRKEKFDLYLSFDTLANLNNCLLKYLGYKGKVALRVVNFPTQRFAGNGLRKKVYKKLISLLYPYADLIYVNSLRIEHDLIELFDVRTPIQFFPNPLDLDLINEEKAEPVEKTSDFTFIHVGGFRDQKNHHLLLESFAKIENPNVKLWLLGKGDNFSQIIKKAKELNIASKIDFLGFQKNPFKYMAAADCMVLSSDYEGLPNVLLEGLACGIPLIATDCPSGPREIIAPKSDQNKVLKDNLEITEYGILVPMNDTNSFKKAMELMIKNKNKVDSTILTKRAVGYNSNFLYETLNQNFNSKQKKRSDDSQITTSIFISE